MNSDFRPFGVPVTHQQDLPAGTFSSWLRRTRGARVKNAGVNVPCGECNVCCRSSYFIHIAPEETQTLARIPKELQFAAPGKPAGHVILGFDEHGRCPMLVDAKCSNYQHRPLTCRNYDCRIYPAAGIGLGEDDQALIAQQTLRWRFSYPSKRDRDQHAAVKMATVFLGEHPQCFPGEVAGNSTQSALLAIEVYHVFLKYPGERSKTGPRPDHEVVHAVMQARQEFEAKRHSGHVKKGASG